MRGVRMLTRRLCALRAGHAKTTEETHLQAHDLNPIDARPLAEAGHGQSTDLIPMLDEQPPARIVAGALAHLARHMETGCPRASSLAILLLDKVANDPDADAHLRRHARQLVDVLEREDSDIH